MTPEEVLEPFVGKLPETVVRLLYYLLLREEQRGQRAAPESNPRPNRGRPLRQEAGLKQAHVQVVEAPRVDGEQVGRGVDAAEAGLRCQQRVRTRKGEVSEK